MFESWVRLLFFSGVGSTALSPVAAILLGGHAERLSNDAADNRARFVKDKDSRLTDSDSLPAATDCRCHTVAVGDGVHVEVRVLRTKRT